MGVTAIQGVAKRIVRAGTIKRSGRRKSKKMERITDYKRAWEIVEQEGYENILKEIRQNI